MMGGRATAREAPRIAGSGCLRFAACVNGRAGMEDDDMSDAPSGPGWWQASDGKWYPPEQASGGQPADASPGTGYGVPYGGAPRDADVGTALSYGWNKFVANIGDIIIIWLIVVGVNLVFNFVSFGIDSIFLRLFVSAIAFIVSMILQIGLIRVGLLVTAGQKVTPAAAFSTDNLAPFIIATLLFGVAYFIGFFALCIGAIIVGFLFWFYGYYVLDANQDPVTSLKSSAELTTKNFGTVGVFAIVAIVLTVITCGLAAPVVQISTAYMYKALNGKQIAD